MSRLGNVDTSMISCVDGLIDALNAGCRIVREIRIKRAHRADGALLSADDLVRVIGGALLPLDALEETLQDGRNKIHKLVDYGNKRFGPDFEAGDEATQMAIMRITIDMQTVLVSLIPQARADDGVMCEGVLDFAECINLTKQGYIKALVALEELYQRKLEETSLRERPSVQEDRQGTERPPVAQRKMEPPVSTQQERWELAPGFDKFSTVSRGGLGGLFEVSGDPRTRNKVHQISQHHETIPAETPQTAHEGQVSSRFLEADRASIYTIDTIASRYSDSVDYRADQASIYHSEVNIFSTHYASNIRLAPKDSDAASLMSTRQIRSDYDRAMYETQSCVDIHRIEG